jgi:hypothetical protein
MSFTSPKAASPTPHTQWDGSIKKAAEIIETVIKYGDNDSDADVRVLHNRSVIRVINAGMYDDLEVGDWLALHNGRWCVLTDERVRQLRAAGAAETARLDAEARERKTA